MWKFLKYLLWAATLFVAGVAALVGLHIWGMQPWEIERFALEDGRSITIMLHPELEPVQPYYFVVRKGDAVLAAPLLGFWNPGDPPQFEFVRSGDLVGIVRQGTPEKRTNPITPAVPSVLVGVFDFQTGKGDGSHARKWPEKRADYEHRLGLAGDESLKID